MAKAGTGHGGKRERAGRPKGSRMRRSDALADELISSGKCPVQALVRLAGLAEAEGDLGQAIGAWKSILPYIYPKPKAIEIAPEAVVKLAQELTAAKANGSRLEVDIDFAERVERAAKMLG